MAVRTAYVPLLEGPAYEGVCHLAERLAHDFGNLLMPLLEYPSLIGMELGRESRSAVLLDTMVKTARDIEHITRQLAMLAQPVTKQVPVVLNQIVSQAMQDVQERGPSAVALAAELDAALPILDGSPEHLLWAIENLLSNGIEAMDGKGGTVTIRTGVVSGAESASPRVFVSVEDQGEGISPSLQDRLFEPFVTAKKRRHEKRGAGLGLSIVYRVVADHGGQIQFETEPGHGSCFTLLLPWSKESRSVEPANEYE